MQPNQLTEHYSYLLSTALILTRNKADAEDLAHDTYIRAYRYINSFTEGNFKGWLYTIMYSIFLNSKRRRIVLDDSKVSNLFGNNVNHILELKDVTNNLARMGHAKSDAVILYSHGYKYDEIAKMTDAPIGTVKSRIFWARKELQRLHGGNNNE